MVSWLTCIIGSSGKSRRKRFAISWGDHSSSSQVVTWRTRGRWASLAGLGRRDESPARQWAFHAP